MNYVKLSILGLKYQRFTSSGCKDMGLRNFEFVAKNSFTLNPPSSYLSVLCFLFSDEEYTDELVYQNKACFDSSKNF